MMPRMVAPFSAGWASFALASFAVSFALAAPPALTQAERVLLVVNDNSPLSRNIGDYYARRRGVAPKNVCHIKTKLDEEISREDYDRQIARPIGAFLRKEALEESIYYIVTTAGVPLKVLGTDGLDGTYASVDSELTLLYLDRKSGKPHAINGVIPNPFFGKRDRAFSHPEFPIYLVTRLAAYD